MPTDTERREVARRLREYVDLPDDWWADTYSGFYVEKCAFGNVERHRESELFARLADLIEPACDRDALVALADEMDRDGKMQRGRQKAGEHCFIDGLDVMDYARRIREALGVADG